MIETPHVVMTQAQPIAMLRLCVSWADMRRVMRPGLDELSEAVGAQGVAVTGPWFTHHFRRPTDTLDFAICLPVATDVLGVGRVESGLLPAVKAARAVMHGDYAGLPTAWSDLRDWIAAQGHTTRSDFWECYAIGPETSADPAAWRTELTWPLTRVAAVTTG